jgi:hypothetical protein
MAPAGFFSRMFVSVATALFWSKPLTDFEKQLAEVEGEKVASGEEAPQWVGITNP